MAQGRSRNSKRTSSSPYASTITTMVFVAMCVFGLWMLTSNSGLPIRTNTRSITDDPSSSSSSSSVTKTPFFPSKEDSEEKENPPPFEDNPGDLPDEAIKSEDGGAGEQSVPATEEVDRQESQTEEKQRDEEEKENQTVQKEQVYDSQEKTEQAMNKENEENRKSESETQETSTEEPDIKEAIEEKKQRTDQEEKLKEQEDQNNDSSAENEKSQNDKGGEAQTKEDQNNDNSEETEKSENDEGGETQTQEDQKDQQSEQQESEIQKNSQEAENIQQLKEDQDGPDSTSENKPSSKETKEQTEQEKSGQQSETPLEGGKEGSQQEGNKENKSAESNSNSGTSFENSGIPKESKESKKGWSTQADQSEDEKERRKDGSDGKENMYGYTWRLCNVTAGTDYIPCLDNEKALKTLHTTGHYEHRERHCPEVGPTCLVPLPDGYKRPILWPSSRDKIWYHNVPHTKLAEVKGHQNWVKVTGEFLTFPGGGTQFIHGALHYIDFVQQSVPNIAWGKRTRVILDVGCGVASFGGYLFDRNVLAMSFAPKDEHEAQVQFALERGIPAISAVMGSQRLPFPSNVFDLIHCARCRVPWHADGGLLLLELNRVLRPGGYFVWSATPVYQKLEEDVEIWKAMSSLTASMCWELVTIKKDKLNSVGAAIYRKPISNECYEQRKQKRPPMCKPEDDRNAAWYVPLQACMHRVPIDEAERGTKWPENWPRRLQTPPYWLNSSQMGIYGKPAPQDFAADYEHWKGVVNKTYINGLGISLLNVRNVMDMRSVYGGFAAALKDLSVWVLNVVNVDSPDTLPIIFERGLFGIYHDWCESFSTYPRTYDLLHADHLFSKLKKRCKLVPVMAEVDRIVRPGGKLIVRDESSAIGEVENLLKSLHWEVHLIFSKNQEGLLSAQKGDWRPETYSDS